MFQLNLTDLSVSPPKGEIIKRESAIVFLCHAHEDGDFAELVQMKLEQEGYTTWMATHRLRAGADWRMQIDESIKYCCALIAIMTPIARKSEYVTYEWAFALGVGIRVIPIVLEKTPLHPRLEALQYLDFTNRSSRPWKQLLEALQEAQRNSSRKEAGPSLAKRPDRSR